MTTEDVLIIKVETDGPVRSHNWETEYEAFPALTRIGFCERGVIKVYEIGDVLLSQALDLFVSRCHAAPMFAGFNIHAETAAVKAAILREFGRAYYDAMDVEEALWKGKRIDIMRSGAKFADARDQLGNPKMPSLRGLYFRCFPGFVWDGDGMAYELERMAKLLPAMASMHLFELKVRQYDDKGRPAPRPAEVTPLDWGVEASKIGVKPETDKHPARPVEAENTAKQEEITDETAEMLLDYHTRRAEEADAYGLKDAWQMHLKFVDWIQTHR